MYFSEYLISQTLMIIVNTLDAGGHGEDWLTAHH